MIKAKKPESNFEYELCPAGTHVARLFKIVNIGTIKEEWEGKEKDSHKIRLYWELPNESKTYEIEKDGKKETIDSVFSISQEYTLSFGERAKLRPIVVGMMGQDFKSEEDAWGFNIEDLLGKSCLLNVLHKTSKEGRQYAVVTSASKLMKGMEEPQPVNEDVIVDVNTVSEEDLEKMYETLRNKIKSSKEWQERQNPKKEDVIEYPEDNIDPEDIPF